MFTGIIETTGTVCWLRRTEQGTQLVLDAPEWGRDLRVGDSLAVNGCCLTLAKHRKGQLVFDLLEETLDLTNLGDVKPGAVVNLERGLKLGDSLDGHLVQGHVDCLGTIRVFEERRADYYLQVEFPRQHAALVARKGSIAIDGVSLTVVEAEEQALVVWIIPHTRAVTRFREARPGDRVNLEFDVLARYVDRWLKLQERP